MGEEARTSIIQKDPDIVEEMTQVSSGIFEERSSVRIQNC